MEHVKIIVLDVVMDECDQDFLLTVGVGAVISIGAFMDAMRKMRAKLFLVFLVVVMFLNEGVGIDASIAF